MRKALLAVPAALVAVLLSAPAAHAVDVTIVERCDSTLPGILEFKKVGEIGTTGLCKFTREVG